MSDPSGFPDSHATGTATAGAYAATGRPYLDVSYIKTLPGILKIAQAVLSFLTFCIACSVGDTQGRAGFAAFVAFFGFLGALVLLLLFLFHVVDLLPRVPWALIELVYYGLWTFFWFVAAICLAVAASSIYVYNTGASGAAAFFAFVCFGLFAFDTFLKFRAWRESQQSVPPPPEAQPQPYGQP